MASDPVLSLATLLRDALQVAMSDADASPVRISFSPTSATPIDICCDDGEGDGQAWVSWINAKPIVTQGSAYTPCGLETEILFVLGISRCGHTIEDNGEIPTADELNGDFEKLTRDFQILRRALLCLFIPESGLDKGAYRLGDYDVHPLRGGCVVSTHEIHVRFDCSPC